MSEKRFKRYLLDGGFWFEEYVEPVWAITDRLDKNSPITHIEFKDEYKDLCDEVVDLLNTLSDENEQVKDKYNEQSVRCEGLEEQVERLLDFKDNVFNLINEKIKHYEHKPFSAPVGQAMSVNFDADVDRMARLSELQDLKKELQE